MPLTSFLWHQVLFIIIVVPCVGCSQYRLNAIDGQCPRGYSYQSSSCILCSPCFKRDWLPNYRNECRSYPNLCMDRGDEELPFQPLNFSSILGSYFADGDSSSHWLVFFFQEDGKATIGKLCLYEASQSEWNSYQKTRLLCNGSDGEQFHRLEAVRVHAFRYTIKPMYFVLMSSDRKDKKKSVLCTIELKDLQKIFKSREFFDPATGTVLNKALLPWPPMYASGYCPYKRPSEWLRGYPLMWTSLDCTGKSFEGTGRFVALETLEKRGQDSEHHKIVFVGTDDGRLLKFSWDGKSFNFLMEMYLTNSSSIGISSLDVIWRDDIRILSVNTSDGTTHIEELQRCNEISSECACQQDPFCHWSTSRVECLEFVDNAREMEGSQRIIKKQCEGVGEDEPLLTVDEFGRSDPEVPTTTLPANHHVTDVVTNHPVPTILHILNSIKPVASDGYGALNVPFYIVFFSLVLVAVIILIGFYIIKGRQHCHCARETDDLLYETDYTKITVKYRSGDGNIALLDENDQESYPTRFKEKGELFRYVYRRGIVTFENLCPSTHYEICYADRLNNNIVCTKGFSFQNSMVDKNTYGVKIAESMPLPEAFIVLDSLSSDNPYKKETVIRGHSFTLPSLPSNMKFTVNVEVVCSSSTSAKRRTSKKIEEIETPAENFKVIQRNGQSFLEWHNLSPRESGLHLRSCSCIDSSDWSEHMPSRDGFKEISFLPAGVDCHLVVCSTFSDGDSSFEHTIAEVDHNTPVIDGSSCAKTLDAIVTLPPDKRQDVTKQMFLCKNSVKVLLELLGSSEDSMAYLTSENNWRSPDDVNNILFNNKEKLKHLQLSKLLLTLMKLLIKETSTGGNKDDAVLRLLNVVEIVFARVHEDEECPSCSQVLLKSRHHVNCM